MIPARGSVSSRNIFSTRTARRSASRAAAVFRLRRANTTPAVGYKNVGCIAREIVDTHLDLCLDAGINHEGINSEVAKGQWEFQIFGKGSKNAADQMWVARYLLMRLCEKYGVDVNWHCKPLGKDVDWNGSGMHTNFSTTHLREVGGKEYFEGLMAAFDKYKNEHIAVYGPDNHLRLTGLHETQSIDKFNYGVGNRGASVRLPQTFIPDGYRGYLEDRRPNSQGDPYKIAGRILQTIATVPIKASEEKIINQPTSGGTGERRGRKFAPFCAIYILPNKFRLGQPLSNPTCHNVPQMKGSL